MKQQTNKFGGFSYTITDFEDLKKLNPRASILLEPVQIEFFKYFHKSLENLVKKAAKLESIPNLPKWLASLWYTPPVLEVHTSSEIYPMDAVWLRFNLEKEDPENDSRGWAPGINLLNFRNPVNLLIPDLLSKVFAITGEINHNGYGNAGRLHHPDPVENEILFYETHQGDRAFYALPDLSIYWEFHGTSYHSEQEREKYGLYLFEQGLPDFLNQYFGALLEKKELQIKQNRMLSG